MRIEDPELVTLGCPITSDLQPGQLVEVWRCDPAYPLQRRDCGEVIDWARRREHQLLVDRGEDLDPEWDGPVVLFEGNREFHFPGEIATVMLIPVNGPHPRSRSVRLGHS